MKDKHEVSSEEKKWISEIKITAMQRKFDKRSQLKQL